MAVFEYEVLNKTKSNVKYIKDRQLLLIGRTPHPYNWYLEVRDYDMSKNEYTYYILFGKDKFDDNCKKITYDDYGREKIRVTNLTHNEIINILNNNGIIHLEYKGTNNVYDKYAIE